MGNCFSAAKEKPTQHDDGSAPVRRTSMLRTAASQRTSLVASPPAIDALSDTTLPPPPAVTHTASVASSFHPVAEVACAGVYGNIANDSESVASVGATVPHPQSDVIIQLNQIPLHVASSPVASDASESLPSLVLVQDELATHNPVSPLPVDNIPSHAPSSLHASPVPVSPEAKSLPTAHIPFEVSVLPQYLDSRVPSLATPSVHTLQAGSDVEDPAFPVSRPLFAAYHACAHSLPEWKQFHRMLFGVETIRTDIEMAVSRLADMQSRLKSGQAEVGGQSQQEEQKKTDEMKSLPFHPHVVASAREYGDATHLGKAPDRLSSVDTFRSSVSIHSPSAPDPSIGEHVFWSTAISMLISAHVVSASIESILHSATLNAVVQLWMREPVHLRLLEKLSDIVQKVFTELRDKEREQLKKLIDELDSNILLQKQVQTVVDQSQMFTTMYNGGGAAATLYFNSLSSWLATCNADTVCHLLCAKLVALQS
jgi:hypothetical protein